MKKRILTLAVALVCFTSCSSRATVPEQYYDRNNWFCIDTPKSFNYDMQKHTTATSSGVCFHDAWGGFIKFEISKLSQDDLKMIREILVNKPTVFKDVFLSTGFEEIRALFPGTQIVYDESFTKDDQSIYFAFIKIPEGGSGENLGTGKRTDSLRGFLVFLEGDHLVVESHQLSAIQTSYYKEGDKFFIEKAKETLLESKQRYRNLE